MSSHRVVDGGDDGDGASAALVDVAEIVRETVELIGGESNERGERAAEIAKGETHLLSSHSTR